MMPASVDAAGSAPVMPTSMGLPPSAAMFAATLAAPPAVQRSSATWITGTGASSDTRCTLPVYVVVHHDVADHEDTGPGQALDMALVQAQQAKLLGRQSPHKGAVLVHRRGDDTRAGFGQSGAFRNSRLRKVP